MDRLQSLHIFVRVVENGSFSSTAAEASVSQATVSKQISDQLGSEGIRHGVRIWALQSLELSDISHR